MLFSDYLTGMSVNAALNQPAYQASNYQAQVAHSANDGNYNTASCTAGQTGIYWWAVDLSQPKFVRGVNVTNDFNTAVCKMPVFLAVVFLFILRLCHHDVCYIDTYNYI